MRFSKWCGHDDGVTLLLPPRLTASATAVAEAARGRGISVLQLPSFDVPAELLATHVHAGPTFVDVIASQLGITALEAPVDWLAQLPGEFTGRRIELVTISEAYQLRWPVFVKTPNDKSIPARIYADGSRLPGPDSVDPLTPVLVSEVVTFEEEHRLHIVYGMVVTASRYAERGRLSLGPVSPGALDFGADLLARAGHTLPSAIVVDVGMVGDSWVVIEANAAWGSGHYAADVQAVLDVILRSAGPTSEVRPADRPFARPQVQRSTDAVTVET
jgi:hypothetical protein